MQDKKATILAVTNGVTGACIAEALKNKTRLKAVLLYTSGSLKKIDSSCLLENGGNIVQIEVNGSEEQCFEVVRQIFKNKDFTSKYNLTLANSVNIGRVLPMIFPYIYAFSRLKNKTCGDIFYAMDAGNYGNLVSGLYAWKSSLPVNGFITNCTDTLVLDSKNKCTILEEKEPLAKSISTDLGNPSNLERLEAVFQTDSQLLKGLVFPSVVTEKDKVAACKLAFKKYGYILDDQTSLAFAATIKQEETILDQDGCVVLIARNHPGFSNNSIKQLLGKTVELPESIKKLQEKKLDGVILPPDAEAIMNHIKTLL